MKRRQSKRSRRGLGSSIEVHRSEAQQKAASAENFYNEAGLAAQRGFCAAAITKLVLGASYEGEVQAHSESAQSTSPTLLRKVLTIRHRTLSTVIKQCLRASKP